MRTIVIRVENQNRSRKTNRKTVKEEGRDISNSNNSSNQSVKKHYCFATTKNNRIKQQSNHSHTHATNKKWNSKLCTGILHTHTRTQKKRRNVNRIQTSHIFGRDINYFSIVYYYFLFNLLNRLQVCYLQRVYLFKTKKNEDNVH